MRLSSCCVTQPGWCTDRLPTHEYLEDAHGRATTTANEGWRRRWERRRLNKRLHIGALNRLGKELPHARQILAAPGIGDQAIVADTVKPARQYMQQKPPHELLGAQRHRLVARSSLDPVILPAKRHATLIQRHEPPVRDRHPVGITRQVSSTAAGPANGRLA